jgi:hypothetical protein
MTWEQTTLNALQKHIDEDQDTMPQYDNAFFQSLQKYRPIYHFLGDLINIYLKPTSVIDWGCGCGYILEKLQMLGITDLGGIEGSKEVLPFIPPTLKDYIEINDVLLFDAKDYDMAITVEVAEHLHKKDSAKFVNSVSASANKWIWWSAAQIGQGGTGHINCQPLSFWESVFKEVGIFEPDWEKAYEIKQAMLGNHQLVLGYNWLHSNFILFRHV